MRLREGGIFDSISLTDSLGKDIYISAEQFLRSMLSIHIVSSVSISPVLGASYSKRDSASKSAYNPRHLCQCVSVIVGISRER